MLECHTVQFAQIHDCFYKVGLCHYNVPVGSQDPLLENALTHIWMAQRFTYVDTVDDGRILQGDVPAGPALHAILVRLALLL